MKKRLDNDAKIVYIRGSRTGKLFRMVYTYPKVDNNFNEKVVAGLERFGDERVY